MCELDHPEREHGRQGKRAKLDRDAHFRVQVRDQLRRMLTDQFLSSCQLKRTHARSRVLLDIKRVPRRIQALATRVLSDRADPGAHESRSPSRVRIAYTGAIRRWTDRVE